MTVQKLLNQTAKSHTCNQIEVLLQRGFWIQKFKQKKIKILNSGINTFP